MLKAKYSILIVASVVDNFDDTFFFKAELTAAIPKVGTASSSSASTPAVQELRKLMEQVDTIKAERDTLEKDLKVQQDDMGECYLQLKFSYALKYCE